MSSFGPHSLPHISVLIVCQEHSVTSDGYSVMLVDMLHNGDPLPMVYVVQMLA